MRSSPAASRVRTIAKAGARSWKNASRYSAENKNFRQQRPLWLLAISWRVPAMPLVQDRRYEKMADCGAVISCSTAAGTRICNSPVGRRCSRIILREMSVGPFQTDVGEAALAQL